MNTTADLAPVAGRATPGSTAVAWQIERLARVDSTNALAATRTAWTAVVAEEQTAGRGRHGRHWVSDRGGLWLSAVVPTPGLAADWQVLPLAAGWAALTALRELGVHPLRLRWPNDLMVGRAKLAGLLVERFHPDRAVIGLGLNLANNPAAADPALAGQTMRLADLLSPPPPRDTVLAVLLHHLALAHAHLAHGRFPQLRAQLESAWHCGAVELQLERDPAPLRAQFIGVDDDGRVVVRDAAGLRHAFAATEIRLLRELDIPS
jgi:BirA family biotin operon repressor/biotin-[acetyl-CoA-carboxylase] ligase